MNVHSVQRKLDAADVPPERLAGHSQLTQQQKVSEAARQFEAVLLRQILESTQKTVIPSSLSNDSTASTIYRDMVTNQLADSISRSGAVGLAKTLESEFLKQYNAVASSETKSASTPGTPSEPSPVAAGPVLRSGRRATAEDGRQSAPFNAFPREKSDPTDVRMLQARSAPVEAAISGKYLRPHDTRPDWRATAKSLTTSNP